MILLLMYIDEITNTENIRTETRTPSYKDPRGIKIIYLIYYVPSISKLIGFF